ncbi:hypothetical protein E3N88_00535 [Mikania micrantha]|uniref:Disease resistance protein At4g27190-like leucine-rich repeats domain-containing protein n=1 Tax=Mikania micrantha TaxID=192012 RepID=A0A5N6PYE1_9ASTR|nr:hypothetical protein E3N88_00535 [Mikania micrantha]
MEEEKAIFVLCGLFPDDSDIALEELLIYTSGCVKMHDLARDFVLSNISRFKQASIVNHGDKWPTHESFERILITCEGMSEFPKDFYHPNLALLKLMNGDKLLKLPEDFHKQMEKLEVMAYEKIQYPLRAQSLCYSMSLRTLCLHSCSLVDNDISFLGNLVTLEVLSLVHCGINRLPSTIKKLKMLKLLDLNGCFELCIDDGVFQSLEKLEELYMRVSKQKSIRFSDANCDELRQILRKLNALEVEFIENIVLPKNASFKNLQRFRISMGCFLNPSRYPSSGDKHSFNNTLQLVTNSNDLIECKINELFSRTEILYLSVKDMSSVGDILMSPSQHSTFSNLKFLNVFGCEKLTHLFTIQMANALKKLESLTIFSCPLLKSIVSSRDGVNVMVLPKLVELKLENLPNFTSIILENDISATQPPLLNKEVMIPNLSRLEINGLKKLKQIWACDYTSAEEDNISKLKAIEVNDCNSLVNLFPCNPMQLLTHLEELEVNNCCSIEVVFNIDLGKIKQHISNLRSIRVYELGELREVWRINEENYFGHLICGFQAVESIHIGNCKKFKNVFTPITANFDMSALRNIYIKDVKVEDVEVCNISGISKADEDMSIVAFPSYHLTRAFNKIRKIEFRRFEGAKVLFEIETLGISGELVSAHQQQSLPLLPCLEGLELHNMDILSYVWKCNNWNKFFILHKNQPQSSFQNLTHVYLAECNGLKYLFSPLMSKLLSSLKTLYIIVCESMEEVVSNRDDDHVDDEVSNTSTTSLFPCLDGLVLGGLYNLKQIGGGVAKCSRMGVVPWSLCQYPTIIQIFRCPSLSTLIPYDAARQMQKLQELIIHKCKSLVEVFESKEIVSSRSNIDQGSVSFPRPETMTNLYHQLTNLKILKISDCPLLEYIFTFSTLESLKKLEKLSICNCEAMKVIVREEHGEETSSEVVFPFLKSIELVDLPNLVGFFMGMNTDFEWQSLDHLMIDKCPQMMVFTSGESIAPKLKYIHTRLGKHDLECGLNFPQEVFEVSNNESPTVVTFPKLREVELDWLDSLKYIWKSNEWSILEFPNLTRLSITACNKLEHVFTASMVGSLIKLQELHIRHCTKMEVIAFESKIDQGSVSFSRPKAITNLHHQLTNLKILKIFECDLLEYVFTFSTLESLKKLEELRISSCKAMKVIVREDRVEESSKVVFPRLKSIELDDLSNLVGFFMGIDIDFEWRSLDHAMINKCPQMMVLTSGESIAPKLKYIHTWLGKHDLECGLNFHKVFFFCNFLSMHHHKIYIFFVSPQSSYNSIVCPSAERTPWSFHNLIEMDLQFYHELEKVVPMNELQQLPILEKVIISSCGNVEEVFEVSNNESPTVVTLQKLRVVELYDLHNLKYIWKSNEWSILEFPNLTTLSIFMCYNLEHVFTSSMVGSLMKLQELHIKHCTNMEVIVKKEEEEECDGKVGEIMFPCLKSLELVGLASLKGFFLGKDDLLFPSMNTLVINCCPEIKIFSEGRGIAHQLKLLKTSFEVFQVRKDNNCFIRNKIQEV